PAFRVRSSQRPRPAPANHRVSPRLSGGGAMLKIAMSPAASALLRALIGRAGVPRDRILLTDAESVDWRSLTLSGERHQIALRIPGPDSSEIAERMCSGLED